MEKTQQKSGDKKIISLTFSCYFWNIALILLKKFLVSLIQKNGRMILKRESYEMRNL